MMLFRCANLKFRQLFACVVAVAALTSSWANAGTIVDTGQPIGIDDAAVLFKDSVDFQYLGISFSVDSAQELTTVRGWFNTHTGGNITASLWADAPSVSSSPLFSSTSFVDASAARWVDFGQTAWSIGPGTYALTFSAAAGYDGGMPDRAPVTLARYWFHNSLYPDWIDTYGLGIGAQILSVSPIPEPGTTVLMMLGLGLLVFKISTARKSAVV